MPWDTNAPVAAATSNSAFMDGDWSCPACGDHQFARNSQCRRCGTPKPFGQAANGFAGKGAAGGGMFGCGFPQGAGFDAASMQGMAATAPTSNNQDMKDGDWMCPACGDHQFARNASCRKCGGPRPADAGKGGGMGGGMMGGGMMGGGMMGGGMMGGGMMGGGMGGRTGCGGMQGTLGGLGQASASNNQSMKDGDWLCASCGDHQFAKNTQCRSCGAARPAGAGKGGMPGGMAGGFGGAAAGFFGGCGFGAHTAALGYGGDMMCGKGLGGGKGGGGNSFAPGDWSCSQCGDHQFARNTTCRRCSAPKPTLSSNNQTMKAGDWICPNPECKDMVFAKNDTCRKCGTAKPEGAGGAARGRSRSPRK